MKRTILASGATLVLLLIGVFAASLPDPAHAATFTVNSTNDQGDATPDGFCDSDASVVVECTLREAIQEANFVGGPDIIAFNIPTGADFTCDPTPGTCTITPLSALPTISTEVTIDASTQPGFSSAPIIELNGASAGAGAEGLTITAGGSTVRGLVINRFLGTGISLQTGDNNLVAGNYVGVGLDGTTDLGNGGDGIGISSTSGGNTIGGQTPADRNVVSGNGDDGIQLASAPTANHVYGNYLGTNAAGTAAVPNASDGVAISGGASFVGGTVGVTPGGACTGQCNLISGNAGRGVHTIVDGNTVRGNFIGTNAAGTADLGNGLQGVFTSSASTGTTIGGTAAGTRNVISGNNSDGVLLSGVGGDLVQGNYIGTNSAGNAAIANSSHGINVDTSNNSVGGTTGTTVGGACTGACNVIAFNGGDGVFVSAGTGNQIRRNHIHSNGGLGIDLGTDGVTANDISPTPPSPQHDADTGANDLQNAPVISDAIKKGNLTNVTVLLQTAPNTQYTIEFFANAACDASGSGEAGTLVFSIAVLTNASGVSSFAQNISMGVPVGQTLTATATKDVAPQNTSEVSNCAQVGGMVVDTTSFASLTSCQTGPNDCSLLGAINNANAGGGSDWITFNIPPSGAKTITPTASLPATTEPVVIDGTTQPGFAGTPIIELNGSGAPGPSVPGLHLQGGSSTVRGLVINRFTGAGVLVSSNGNQIAGNYIGTDIDGAADLGNGGDGVLLGSTTGSNTVGGFTVADRNVISGNTGNGVMVFNANGAVRSNYIGTNAAGTAAIGNGQVGVRFDGVTTSTIDSNVISGNVGLGIRIHGAAPNDENGISANYIGTNAAGTTALGNLGGGVSLETADNDLGSAGAGNVISGNTGNGVTIANTANRVRGNFIGTDVTGTIDLGNTANGIAITAGSSTIGGSNGSPGGSCTGSCNLISGNGTTIGGGTGILITNATGNTINGNYIGTDVTGTTAISNVSQGIATTGTASGVTIGGGTAATRNVISGNDSGGINLSGASNEGATVRGNFIGINAAGTAGMSNFGDGVAMDTSNNTIGGSTGLTPGGSCTGHCNLISGNTPGDGVQILNSSGNVVLGNYIGTDITGTSARSNGSAGVNISGTASANTIGLTASNIISGNGGVGVVLSGAGGDTVQGNYIGVDRTGNAPLGNSSDGIDVDTPNNYVAFNIISGNNVNGVDIRTAAATGNTVEDNSIGVGADTATDVGNLGDGVRVSAGASGNSVGNSGGPENFIGGNAGQGVEINGAGINNVVRGNHIGEEFLNGDTGNDSHAILISGTNNVEIGSLTQLYGNSITSNGGDGVHIVTGSNNNIGKNVIRLNTGDGVHVASGTGNRVSDNRSEDNGGLAIDLAGGTQDSHGVTANDPAPDSDSGANSLQNYPVIDFIDVDFQSNIFGSLDSTANTTFSLEFFYDDACDFSLHGEAGTFLVAFNVTTDGTGHDDFQMNFATPAEMQDANNPRFITGTATDPAGNTSEFSLCEAAFDDENDDNDAHLDIAESACGSNPMDPASLPERIDTGHDDDRDGQTNEALPAGSEAHDCDADGATGSTETASLLTHPQDPDSDNDGDLDGPDNCPNWPNASQQPPAWSAGVPLTGTGTDSDCDRLSNSREAYLGTDPTKQCASTGVVNPPPSGSGLNDEPLPDRWPFDMNDSQNANTADVGQFVFSLNSKANQTPPDPRWNQRHDLDGSGIVNTADVGRYVFVLNRSCSPAGP